MSLHPILVSVDPPVRVLLELGARAVLEASGSPPDVRAFAREVLAELAPVLQHGGTTFSPGSG